MYNRITLVGRIHKQPAIRYIGSGQAVSIFEVAVGRDSKMDQEIDVIPCIAWDRLAETVNTYGKKDGLVLVEGSLQRRSYQTKEGADQVVFDVVATTIRFLDAPAGRSYPTYEP
jgi:single-strand DNA-binding protein